MDQLHVSPDDCKIIFNINSCHNIYFIYFKATTRKFYEKRLRDHLMHITSNNKIHEKINKMEKDISLLRRKIEVEPIRSYSDKSDSTQIMNRNLSQASPNQDTKPSLKIRICCQLFVFILSVVTTSLLLNFFAKEINHLFLNFINFLIEFLKKLSHGRNN